MRLRANERDSIRVSPCACRPTVGFLSLGLSLSHRCISPFLTPSFSFFLFFSPVLPVPSLLYSADYSATLRREIVLPLAAQLHGMQRSICGDLTAGAFAVFLLLEMHFSLQVLPLSRIGNSNDSEHYVVLLNIILQRRMDGAS